MHAHLKDNGASLDLSDQLRDCVGLHLDPPPEQDAVKAAIQAQWTAAEVCPSSANAQLTVTSQQAEQLKLFAL